VIPAENPICFYSLRLSCSVYATPGCQQDLPGRLGTK
jgi:hypothetical protein